MEYSSSEIIISALLFMGFIYGIILLIGKIPDGITDPIDIKEDDDTQRK